MPYSPQDVYKKVLGNKGEKLVVAHLKKLGLVILEQNYRTPFGEADIIAKDKDEVAFIEVKTRSTDNYGAPREAVVTAKQKRYKQIAKFYWLQTGEEPNARFDVAEVDKDGKVSYIPYAF